MGLERVLRPSVQGSLHNIVPLQASDGESCPKLNDTETKELVFSEFTPVNATQYYKVLTLKYTSTYFRTFSQWKKHF